MDSSPYTKGFYDDLREKTERSAREIVPLIIELIRPESVIDVGCGVGIWLAAFESSGFRDILGVDGDHIDRSMLAIPVDKFMSLDLKKPFRLKRQFDLTICLEVAEHLPEEAAEEFVNSLTRLGPIVLFSAAIPFQGGEQHINEQWPDYWVALFREKNYVVIDCLRKRIWNNDNVEWWYAQNMLLFAKTSFLNNCPSLQRELENADSSLLSIVHPRNYIHTVWMKMLYHGIGELRWLIPPETTFILIDNGKLGLESFGDEAIPFLEKDGSYWGPPQDDDIAIRELERLRKGGADFIVFLWPAFWWLEYYTELDFFIRSKFCCVLQNERLIVFDMRQ
ncbi:MAG: class I SAM-dependent methyltransferase [Candidatus Thiodiazotropha sp. (ex Rostrolucina anterorostrata)]|nr:class I SAM-dependent methyltransferase [Candidatus Thiodiazotropha sp. (ex Rostrolucina anterorostrata)]